ncbi:NADH-quinone oxidoreductase subunit NuoG [Anaerolineae bacterium CFX9]|nr:NADH-quinone oxidoreductase subunit NuoG [Anaerolineae bacterium CFX9]
MADTPIKTVKVTIDDVVYDLPAGTNLVDAAKVLGNDIPVFCYHPKMKPVGMCRMCLVEQGAVEKNRETGEVVLDDKGQPKVRWMPKLQTACTQSVADGMVIRTNTPVVAEARKSVLEFLLTSHPLDCPICDKGGECPLQNLTMAHGPGTSRMNYEDKMHLDKHVPLGDLIFLDEERCIQCARCIRFQDEVVGDPVLGFHERGRRLQIVTTSDPGFDTYFSGNTTDICPVGALTTADFRFGARPWELTNVPSICPHCPVGCNTSASTRLDRDFGGRAMIKRIMPRQNEEVNEIWICDKGRFGHHFTRSDERLMEPMLRSGNGDLVTTTWAEAIRVAGELLSAAGGDVAAIAGSGMSNEDLWTLRQLVTGLGGERLGAWPPTHGGAELAAQVGVGKGTNLGRLGKGDSVLVIASDLEEEAPIWYLRLKQAADRGAHVVVANARPTQMDSVASETARYETGAAAQFMASLKNENEALASKLAGADNLIIVVGAEGLTLEGSRALAQAAANFLIETGHVGKPQNGLLLVLPGANGMGLHYTGFSPEVTQAIAARPPKVLIVAQADILADDPAARAWLSQVETIIDLSLFPDETAMMATLALPIQSFAERDGTFTNGERRVQRFYTAQGPMGEALPAWQIISRVIEKLELGKAKLSAAQVMNDMTQQLPAFSGMRYSELAKVAPQFPDVGGEDLYYGGTSYKNTGGLGVQTPTAADAGERVKTADVSAPKVPAGKKSEFVVVPTTRLYNRERVFSPSVIQVLGRRVSESVVELNAADAAKLKIRDGDWVRVTVGDSSVTAQAHVNGSAPQGTILLPRHLSEEAAPLTISVGAVSKVEG